MGSWNKTCGISRLHIKAEESVYVFVLEQNKISKDRCYATAFWKPVMLPFQSVYNDYGGGKDSDQYLQYVIEGLKENMIEVEQGENPYHDIPVKKDKMDEVLFFEAVHEGRLFVKGHDENAKVDFVMLKKSIVDYILNNHVIEYYVAEEKGTQGYKNSYMEYTFVDIVNDCEEFITAVEKELKELSYFSAKVRGFAINIGSICKSNIFNKVDMYLRGIRDYRFSGIIDPICIFMNLLTEDKKDEAKALLIEVLRASFINEFMKMGRINWGPAGHEGSQCDEHLPYRVLCSAITAELDKEVAEEDDDD